MNPQEESHLEGVAAKMQTLFPPKFTADWKLPVPALEEPAGATWLP